uniref:Uncharacterized protein n=1 Tax=Magallana gigas TaxID=29159 RepID=A0A8W8MUI6_MAGGI
MVIQMFLCPYVNWCSSCSNVQIETAVNVSTVDWSGCTARIQYNMTVTNSDSVVLYRNSTSCCSGNLTIHYSLGNGMTTLTLTMTNKSSSNPVMATGVDSSAKNTTQTDQLEKGNGMATLTLTMTNKSSSNPVMATGVDSSAKKTTLTDQLKKGIYSNALLAYYIALCQYHHLPCPCLFKSKTYPTFDITACHLR